jgi:hypothetical protein
MNLEPRRSRAHARDLRGARIRAEPFVNGKEGRNELHDTV